MISECLKLVFSLSLSGSLLLIVLFLLHSPIKGRVTKAFLYYIWLVALLRFLLPFSPAESIMGNLWNRLPQAGQAAISETIGYEPYDTPFALADETGLSGNNISQQANAPFNNAASSPLSESTLHTIANPTENKAALYIGIVWAGVCLALLIRKITAYESFLQFIRAGSRDILNPDLLDVYSGIGEKANIKKLPRLMVNPITATPILIGIYKPAIILPDEQEPGLSNILLHELIHHKRRDIFYKWLILITCCIHWFNPLVWYAAKQIQADCELSCDEGVLRLLGAEQRRQYGETLFSSLQFGGSYKNHTASLTLSENGKQIKERLDAIMNYKQKSKDALLLSCTLTLILSLGAVTVGAYNHDAINSKSNKVKEVNTITSSIGAAANTHQTVVPLKSGTADTTTPDNTVAFALSAIKNQDLDAFNIYTDNLTNYSHREGYTLFNPSTANNFAELKEIVKGLSWSITGVKTNGDKAVVSITIQNYDYTDVIGIILVEALTEAADNMYSKSSESWMEPSMAELMQTMQNKTISFDVDVSVNRQTNGSWIVHLDHNLSNAICGNLLTERYSAKIQKQIDDATDALSNQFHIETNEAMSEMGAALSRDFIQEQEKLERELEKGLEGLEAMAESNKHYGLPPIDSNIGSSFGHIISDAVTDAISSGVEDIVDTTIDEIFNSIMFWRD